MRLQLAGVRVSSGIGWRGRAVCRIRRRRFVFASRLSRWDNTGVKVTGSGSGRNRWFALVHRSTELRITARQLNMLRLCRDWRNVAFVRIRLLLRGGMRLDPAATPVIAYPRSGDIGYAYVVRVVDDGGVYATHISVVAKVITFPPTPFVSIAAVAEAVIDAPIPTDVRAPVPFIKNERDATPTPVAWCP